MLIEIKEIRKETYQITFNNKPTHTKSEVRQLIQKLDNALL